MRNIKDAFEDKKAFIAYLTAGDPDIETTRQLVLSMEQAGVDIVEIGIPYDKVADGLTDLKESNNRGLASKTKAEDVFTMISDLSKKVRIPMLILSYMETIEEYGTSRFMRKCKECNVAGLVVPDYHLDEKSQIAKDSELFGVDLISVIRPGSREEITKVAKRAKGFVYCESKTDEMGKEIKYDLREMVALVRATAQVPCAMGFGISTPDQAKDLARIADGVIIGTGIVKAIAQNGKDCIRPVTDYVRTMKAAIRQA